jgi:hypothetical protein
MNAHLSRLADARQELTGARLAEARLREIQTSASNGILPETGGSRGTFSPPNDYLRWELSVEPASVPLPEHLAETQLQPSSSIFVPPSPTAAPGAGITGSLLRVSLRVFPEAQLHPESVDPYVLYLVEPPTDEQLSRLEPGP